MNLQFRTIDLDSWERRNIFQGFINFDFPNSIVGLDLDITNALSFWKSQQLSPYMCLVYAVCKSANQIPAFKQRIRGDKVVELETVHADFTVPSGKELFAIKHTEFTEDFATFYAAAKDPNDGMFGWPGDGDTCNDHWVYMSAMPWIKFTHVTQPTDKSSASIPRIAWGKFSEESGKVKLPLSVQTHHALVDGIHVAQFVEQLENLLSEPVKYFI